MKKFLIIILILVLASCSSIDLPGQVTPTPAHTTTPTVAPSPTPAPTQTPVGPVTLRIWLPPEFNPAAETEAGGILQARLDQFVARRPNVRIEVRIKASDGAGGLLDSLTSASAAAPIALPDLVALPREVLETAALKGLLHPFDDLSVAMESTDWFDYARELARIQDSTFGLPFAGDSMILVYRPAKISEPPLSHEELLQSTNAVIFPAADPRALFTLALYQASDGPILDDQDRPTLDAVVLGEVLTFYHNAASSEVIPFWITQFENDDQAWGAYQENRADMVITWTSRYLGELPADSAATPLPLFEGNRYTLASGWVWSLASLDPERQTLATELAEFLCDSDFIAAWTAAIGYLPTRPSALENWQIASLTQLTREISLSAHVLPAADILTSLAPALEQATVEVLKLQTEPATAAQEAAKSLSNP